ncbi:MAG: hypothetical protein ACRYFU_01735 [Janthinobacterium lividum]
MITNQKAWKLYGRYAEAWKPISEEQRTKILGEVLDEEFHFTTPEFEGGLETLLEDIAGIQKKVPGGYFVPEDVSAHKDVALLTWVLVQPDGGVLAKGHDQIRVTPEGKIVDLITFAPSVAKPSM